MSEPIRQSGEMDEQVLLDWVAHGEAGGRATGSWTTCGGFAQEIIHFDSDGILWAVGPRVPTHPIALNHYVITGQACGFWPWQGRLA